MQPHPSWIVTFGIPSLALIVVALIALALNVRGQRSSARRFVLGAALWFGVSAGLALSGSLAREELSPLPLLSIVLPTLGLPLAFGLSRAGRELAQNLPLAALVGFHAFRLPLELVMHQAAVERVMPPQMTFTGSNFDIVTGISALLIGLWLWRGQAPGWLVLAFNLVGSCLLLAIIGVALASMPRFHLYGSDPEHLNTWVFYFPFVWLPAGLVAAALLGHVVLWRRLWLDAHESALSKADAFAAQKSLR
ncbi:MAG TPA: hypothetical protein VFZ61_04435 [Polyangiales bacterium]